jgi:ribose 5-phosphate isomerase A
MTGPAEKKRAAARAALEQVEPGSIVGVGTGSTADHFIEGLADIRDRVVAAVASSARTAERLVEIGIRVIDLGEVDGLPLYVDGADEATARRQLIKGGGGALTREKIVAAASRRFVCIVDDSKIVERLGAFPLPVEVIPMARRQVAREIRQLGGRALERSGFVTDNGNVILDVHGLEFSDPAALESGLNQIAGVLANGLFCRRPADLLLVGGDDGVEVL